MGYILEDWPNGQNTELSDDFVEWVKTFDPTMIDCGYSGDLYGLYMAWEAGRQSLREDSDRESFSD